ncbi:MAG: hypothetical protein JRH20_24615, partial [Deltaproteobacteria bacterium]|nr:hypothetical protein [Deltaproteobacteria bacterium]
MALTNKGPLFLLCSALSLAACPVADDTGLRAHEITEGIEHTEHPAVGFLLFSTDDDDIADSGCTATLIGPQLLISAAHCLIYDHYTFETDDGS